MPPEQWLPAFIPGYCNLSDDEKNAIYHFALLWSLFESRVLNSQGRIDNVELVPDTLAAKLTDVRRFDNALGHFRQRYVQPNGDFTAVYRSLSFGPNENRRPIVESMLAAVPQSPTETLRGLLIIVWRLRNNLFHGLKWDNEIRDQLDNFRHANEAIMTTLDIFYE